MRKDKSSNLRIDSAETVAAQGFQSAKMKGDMDLPSEAKKRLLFAEICPEWEDSISCSGLSILKGGNSHGRQKAQQPGADQADRGEH